MFPWQSVQYYMGECYLDTFMYGIQGKKIKIFDTFFKIFCKIIVHVNVMETLPISPRLIANTLKNVEV